MSRKNEYLALKKKAEKWADSRLGKLNLKKKLSFEDYSLVRSLMIDGYMVGHGEGFIAAFLPSQKKDDYPFSNKTEKI